MTAMAEYIEREAFLAHMKKTDRYFNVKYDIEEFPAADVVPVVHGRWILHSSGNGTCSVCRRTTVSVYDFDSALKYCPHCGADMRGDV